MNDVCFILLILVLIIIISRNSEVKEYETLVNILNEEDGQEEEVEQGDNLDIKEEVEVPKKLVNASENTEPPRQIPNEIENNISGYEQGDVFASYEDNYGDVVPHSMQADYALLRNNNVIRPNIMNNLNEDRSPGFVSDSQAPSFDPTANTGLMAVGQVGEVGENSETKGSSKSVEVHMVYAEWCGHSQNAIPAFEELTKVNKVKTQSGVPVKFVMTEEKSDGFKEFKGKVQGFPTYMTVEKENGETKNISELLVQSRSKEGIIDASKELV